MRIWNGRDRFHVGIILNDSWKLDICDTFFNNNSCNNNNDNNDNNNHDNNDDNDNNNNDKMLVLKICLIEYSS